MKFVFFAVIIYGAYLLLRFLFNSIANSSFRKVKKTPEPPARKIDISKIEDADFEEIKKEE